MKLTRTVQYIIAALVLIIVAGGSFYAGTVYGKNQAQAALRAAARQRGMPFAQGTPGAQRFQGRGMVFGTIEEVGADGTLVVKDNNGSRVKVRVTDTTLIEKTISAAPADLQSGESVMISGTSEQDGSITARSVQVVPAGRLGLGAPGAPGAPGSAGGQ
ncbi:MAG: DUF5666 domain-containing protein [Anaerolineae bacterium]